jgi:hypothetical protein
MMNYLQIWWLLTDRRATEEIQTKPEQRNAVVINQAVAENIFVRSASVLTYLIRKYNKNR